MEQSGQAAFEYVCETLSSPTFEAAVGGNERDIAFLTDFMNNIITSSLVSAHETLDVAGRQPVSCDNIELLREVLDEVEPLSRRNKQALQLWEIIANPHFQALIEAHDDVAAGNFEELPEFVPISTPPPQVFSNGVQDAIRMVGVRKTPEEPLGITVRKDLDGMLVIARIMAGSSIDRQGLLHVGDIIKEVNGQEVTDPDQLQEVMKKSSGSVTFKILPSLADNQGNAQIHLRTHFNYDPKKDNLIPCRDAGLAFSEGEILQVVSMDDPNWWQAKKVTDDGPSGLIPSQALEEKRKAFVRPEYDYTHKSLLCGIVTKKKRKVMYHTKQSAEYDRHELMIYEEVTRMPPFQRKTLVLIGPPGIGRRTLKTRLIKSDNTRFGAVVPHTSRPIRAGEIDGDGYWYVTKDRMDAEIANGKFLEWGEFDGHLYGTKLDEIRRVIEKGKMCILDLNPTALKAMKMSKFMPFIVFIAAPPVEILRNMHEFARQQGKTDQIRSEQDLRFTVDESAKLEKKYKSFFDLVIVNDNMNDTYQKMRKAIENLTTEAQWVPTSWVY